MSQGSRTGMPGRGQSCMDWLGTLIQGDGIRDGHSWTATERRSGWCFQGRCRAWSVVVRCGMNRALKVAFAALIRLGRSEPGADADS
ncbi:MAG: hypothetical protein KF833_04975 [Verrucomicrobiae bacterium]|nr:hypothetical protein [Verrucomicrobiae bacterium]